MSSNQFQRPRHIQHHTYCETSSPVKDGEFLTCGLSQLFTQTYVGELQQLLPFLTLSFSVPAASWKTNSLGF